MEWTTTPPTVGGLYWAYDGEEVQPVDLYFVSFFHVEALRAFCLGDDYDVPRPLEIFTHWQGPFPIPDPPK